MRLRKLKCIGFKSFADEIVLEFGDGIVAIVGPNGCGKSNIVDAFRWVMGEQGVRQLRAERTTDLIFAGNGVRRPLSMAEVSLTLEEEGGSHIVVTRRAFASGESEFFINKQKVRLKDVYRLFLGTGVGKNAFSLFEQGKLDQIIHLTPLERRIIFDEAAGIGKFLQEKKEAGLRLKEVDENVSKVNVLHEASKTKRERLKKEVEQNREVKEKKKHLASLKKSVAHLNLEAAKSKEHYVLLELSTVQDGLKESEEKQLKTQKAYDELREEIEKKGAHQKLVEEERRKNLSQYEIYRLEINREKERLDEGSKRQEALLKEQEELTGKGEGLEKKGLELQEKKALLLEKKRALEKERETNLKECLLLEKALTEKNEEEKKLRIEERNVLLEEGKSLAHLKERELLLKQSEGELKSLNERKGKSLLEKEQKTAHILEKKGESETLLGAIEEEKKELVSLQKESENSKNEQEKLQNALLKLNLEANTIAAKKGALVALKMSFEGLSTGAISLLKESKKVTPLIDLIEISSNEKAVASFLERYKNTLVVETETDLQDVLELARAKKITDFSLLCKKGPKESVQTLLFEGVNFDDTCFHDHHGVLFILSDKERSSPFLREKEILALENKEVTLRDVAHQTEKELLEKKEAHEGLLKKMRTLDEGRRKKEMVQFEINFKLQLLQSELKKLNEEQDRSRKREESLICTIENNQKLREEASRLCLEQKQKKEKLEALLKEREKSGDSLTSKYTLVKNEKVKLDATLQEFLLNFESLNSNAKILENQIEERKNRVLRIEEELKGCLQQRAERQKRIADLSEKLTFCQKASEKHFSEEQRAINEVQKVKELEKPLLKSLLDQKGNLADLRSKQKRLEGSLDGFVNERQKCEEEFASLPDVELVELESIEKGIKVINRLTFELEGKEEIEVSLEALEVEEKQFLEIDRQLHDLSQSQAELRTLVTNLENQSRALFKTTFDHIRRNFQKNFPLLFHGGRADLLLTDKEDLLETGVEIVAEPPGKQMRSMNLLSGGEKCMTALALLFSIFEVKPSPFCILDEVDAPLDEANVSRFTELVSRFAPLTQFIVVTHNKKTMKIADLLFGISMEEKGVSKLISLQFEKKMEESHA